MRSWRVESLIPFAVETYRNLEEELDTKFFHKRNLIRSLFNSGEENDWHARLSDDSYRPYMADEAEVAELTDKTAKIYGYGEVTEAYQTEMHKLVAAYREKLLREERITLEKFNFEKLELLDDGVKYGDMQAEKIIFCDGEAGSKNPFWSYLPWVGTKGEVLIVRIPDADFSKMFKYRIFIVPLPEQDLYWVGSKYEWHYDDNNPTAEGKQYLKDRLADALTVPFEIVAHKAAVRPTNKDRRPFLGLHPEFPQVGIFNGLGTKGASLGPYFAKEMTDFLTAGKAPDAEVRIERFG